MGRRLLRWLSPLLLALALVLPPARAQPPVETKTNKTEKVDNTERTPAVQVVVGFLFLVIILLILCMPSRKSSA
jgi:hypothetical protein